MSWALVTKRASQAAVFALIVYWVARGVREDDLLMVVSWALAGVLLVAANFA